MQRTLRPTIFAPQSERNWVGRLLARPLQLFMVLLVTGLVSPLAPWAYGDKPSELPARAPAVTFDSLLSEMIDRDRLARLPDPWYFTRQTSSYDRASVAADQPGWFANMDRSHFERVETNEGRTEYVMLDHAGPGAIVRIWATWHGAHEQPFSDGTIRFYLDNEPVPAIEGPISKILDGGGLCTGPLSQGVAPQTAYLQQGHNLYLPIPFARHCKITYETDAEIVPGAPRGEALYYQINFRAYEEGTTVETFSMDLLQRHQQKLDQVQQTLLQPQTSVEEVTTRPMHVVGTISGGGTLASKIQQGGVIRKLTIDVQAEDLPQALRSTILELVFDGQRTVWCPVGEFFGRSYQSDPHQTWVTRVTEDEMTIYWLMPFEKSCEVRFVNLSEQPVTIRVGQVDIGEWQWCDRSMHFHSIWHQLTQIDTFRDGATRPGEGAFDVNYVTITGQGVYVGDTLSVFNGTDAWWGEGDEKIYIDGESFPSHFGTGTEDYYGYAWCRPEYFSAPFHAQPSGAGNFTPGLTVNSRYRALDAIPFRESLRVDMEMWHWRSTKVNFAPATFWYARPGGHSNIDPDPATAALPVRHEP